MCRESIHLRHVSGDVVTFKHYKHRGKWMWNDSRSAGPCGESHVQSEIARMVCKGDLSKASEIMAKV